MCMEGGGACTCQLHVGGGISFSHGINLNKLLFKDGQQEGEAIVQPNVQDELMKQKIRNFSGFKTIKQRSDFQLLCLM